MSSITTPRCLSHDQYSIGIICPLGDELAAVEAMLDQIDTTLPTVVPGSAYTLGSIGDHNVVIAVLPRSGEASAAWAGANLLRNFPAIKFGLLVGIGGGVPGDDEERDVRLGDVVVSYADGAFGGVVQYSFGKMRAGWKFERTGSIDSPPAGVTAQVNKLRARHIREGSQIPAYLDAMVKRYPRMVSYSRPKNSPDRLFLASYAHVSGNANCSRCDAQHLIQRPERPSDEPMVFYGVIGSGDQVVRSPELRDQLKQQYGILCVDMEAAGLMHDFPCLVIRGISDYADSHKNDTYKRYAAATAAAYMKELLLLMPSQDIRYIPAAPTELQKIPLRAPSSISATSQPTNTKKYTQGSPETMHRDQKEDPSISSAYGEDVGNLNILILGEIGVGKSTFINAFVNYLQHESLDTALQSDKLSWVIPSSFVTMTRAGESIIENKIIVGGNEVKHDVKSGQSATQRTNVYPITIGSTTYRLIDTPGIGDTRGLHIDERVLRNIFQTISRYDVIHGIVILFKSNNARLTFHFRQCIQSIWTHIHRDAVNNVVFGFTNTRISNYTAGDTYMPLRSLLSEHTETGLSMASDSMYCVDSEGFRYLAAAHQGIQMDNKKDFRHSWQRSSEEMRRMITHFNTIKPHRLKHTLNLNKTHRYIQSLMGNFRYIIVLTKEPKTPSTWGLQQTHRESYRQQITEERTLEYETILFSIARLSVYLREISILTDDDTTVRPLDRLIEVQQSNIKKGGGIESQQNLTELKKAREMLLRMISEIEYDMKANSLSRIVTEDEIPRIKDQLSGLKHFGNRLRDVLD